MINLRNNNRTVAYRAFSAILSLSVTHQPIYRSTEGCDYMHRSIDPPTATGPIDIKITYFLIANSAVYGQK